MSLVPPQPAPTTPQNDACTREHAFHAFDTLYCSLTHAAPIAPSFPDEKYPLFITWNKREGREWHLRGCIGNFSPMPLHDGLAEYALVSAFRDTRFHKIERSELERLECGVSLLTDFEPAASYLDWTVGVHGISITFPHPSLLASSASETPSPASSSPSLPKVSSRHSFRACYLPEVMPEQGWDKLEAIDSAIHKAGWRGRITEDLRRSITLERYQSSRVSVTWGEYIEWRKAHET